VYSFNSGVNCGSVSGAQICTGTEMLSISDFG
jgi:hypothetical protein